MKLYAQINGVEFPILEVLPDDMKKLLAGKDNERLVGYPMYFCIWPTPENKDIRLYAKDESI